MKLSLALFVFNFFIYCSAFAQVNGASNRPAVQPTYYVLPDSGYTFNQVLTDSTLPFKANDSIRPSNASVYWVKITIANPSGATGQYNLTVHPFISNTFYYFDAVADRFIAVNAGFMAPAKDPGKRRNNISFLLPPQPAYTIYIHMDVTAVKKFTNAGKPTFVLATQADVNQRQQILWDGLVAVVAVVLFFLLYNVYIYCSLKDVSVLYYIIMQVGTLLYIIAYRRGFQFYAAQVFFSTRFDNDGVVDYYGFNGLFMHMGILLVIYGFIQLTRAYLNTRHNLPLADTLLKYGLYTYITASLVLMVINMCWFYIEHYTLLYDNVFLLILISFILYTCVLGYRRRLPAAGAFLLANMLPLVLMIGITVSHVFISIVQESNLWLPNMAIVSQAFCFSVALVARTRLVEKHLDAKKLEAMQLQLELKELELQYAVNLQQQKSRNDALQYELEANRRELASNTVYLVQKNELLATLKTQIEELERLFPGNLNNRLPGIESILQSNLHLDDDWAKFKLHFEKVHPDFFENLYAKHPSLTKGEVRLCAYFHMNLSSKEIAALLNIAPTSVRIAKSRLLKKMGNLNFLAANPDVE